MHLTAHAVSVRFGGLVAVDQVSSGDGRRPTLNVVFVKPDPKMFEDDEPPKLIEHRPPVIDVPANPPTSVPIISPKRNGGGSWMD
jgi:hypothetical protein